MDCPEFLCVKCAAVHTKMRLTATHRLVDLSTVRARASVPVPGRAHVRVRAHLRISTGSAAAGCACERPQARQRLRNPAAIPSAPPAGGCRGVTDGCAAHPGAPLLLWYAPVRRQPTRV